MKTSQIVCLSLAALSLIAADAPDTEIQSEYEESLKCRVLSKLLPEIGGDDPQKVELGRRIHQYWIKRNDTLGKSLGKTFDPESWEVLLIPYPQEREPYNECAKKVPLTEINNPRN